MTTDAARKIISTQKGSGTKVSVIHNCIFEPVMRRGLSLIRKGDLGEIVNADVHIVVPPSDPMLCSKDHWCHSTPGGRFGEMLAHPIYILQAILGQVRVRSVHALKRDTYPWVKFDELWVELEADKSFGSIYASFNSIRHDWFINVYGTKGIIKLNLINESLVRLKQRPVTTLGRGIDTLQQASQLFTSTVKNAALKLSGKWASGHEVCLHTFMDSVLNGKASPVTLEDAYHTVEILEQICEELDLATKKNLVLRQK
jgi:predicted dehydrogenase